MKGLHLFVLPSLAWLFAMHPIGFASEPQLIGLSSNALHKLAALTTSSDASVDLAADHGTRYWAAYPVSMRVDGDLDDWDPELPWHAVTHDQGVGNATNDADASFDFAVVADANHLFFAVRIRDNEKLFTPEESKDPVNQDSVELYVGGELILVQRQHVRRVGMDGREVSSGKQMVTVARGVEIFVVDEDDGWHVEFAVPFKTTSEVAKTAELDFNIRLNDDDDGGAKDHTLIWSHSERNASPPAATGLASGTLRLLPLE